MRANIVGQSASSLKHLLMTSFFGVIRRGCISQTALPTCLSILEITVVLNARKNGRDHRSCWRGNGSPEVARNIIFRYSNAKTFKDLIYPERNTVMRTTLKCVAMV